MFISLSHYIQSNSRETVVGYTFWWSASHPQRTIMWGARCDGRGRALTTGTGCLGHLRVLLYFAQISGSAEGVKRITKTCNLRLIFYYLNVCSAQEKWTLVPSWKPLRRSILELWVITFPLGYHWKCVRCHCACAESRDPWVGGEKQLHFLKSPTPICLFTLQLFLGYDDD